MAWWKLHKRDKPGGPPGAGGAMLASAAIITRDQVRSVVGRKQEWQAQGWDFYRSVSELKSGVRWAANGCSRARLYVGRIDPDGSSKPIPVDAQSEDLSPGLVAQLLAPLEELAGGQLGQSEMLRRLSVHLDIPGESYLVGFDDPESGERRWLVCSPSEVTSTGGGGTIRVQLPDSQAARVELSLDECTLIRLWRPDDEYAYLPDSPLNGLQDPLRELQGLTAHVLATVDSRLQGAGLGLISDDVTPASPQQSDGANPIHSDPVTAALIEAASASLRNRDSAAALVPLLLRVPGSVEDKFKWFSFATELDEQVLPLREAAIKRLAIGLDMPPEVLTGLADTNHWNAWIISDDSIKLHLEPKLGLICDTLTSQYFRAAWDALGVPDPENWACWYDTSDLKQRPNRAPEAAEAHARGAISDAAYLRELGFSTEDMPDEDEQQRRLLVQLATTNAQLAPAALEALGVQLPDVGQAIATDAVRAPVEISRAAPAVEAPTRTEPPALPIAASAVLDDGWRMNCLDLAARRALARAGNWLLSRSGRSRRGELAHVPVHEVHMHVSPDQADLAQMLDGAYRDFHAATPGDTDLHAAVDLYVRRLLLTGIAHERGLLAGHLGAAGCDRAAA
ncbi:hypothetical protein ACIOZL_19475 [Streptomyces sp. NPDC087769]|uniref:hypothetical protein n=1 Tax=Streptomyces sp. NPDC087769 TaxID=3365802 RepID=UPI00380E2E58